jgi:hypothetical protein
LNVAVDAYEQVVAEYVLNREVEGQCDVDAATALVVAGEVRVVARGSKVQD